MNSVYIYNANKDKIFSSLLMNDLSIRGVNFSNLQTTKVINPDNILIYIPRVGIGNNEYSDIFSSISNVEDSLLDFKLKIVPFINYKDYKSMRVMFDGYFGRRNFEYYQGIGFDTFYSRIIANKCARLVSRRKKFHSR